MKFSLALATAFFLFRSAKAAALPGRNGFPNLPGRIPAAFGVTIPDLGSMNGTATGEPGVERFVVRYATASRWKAPIQVTKLQTLSSLPAVCPQANGDSWEGDEDCLFMVLYVPENPKNILTWVHGGSLLVGGANDPMIEGSKLAKATASVVAVVQYRLGVLGFLPPSTGGEDTNLGVRDLIVALNFLKTLAVGLDLPAGAITVAGQSSGATAVRALLSSPSASPLFSKAILHSDTADYAFYKPSTLTTFRNAFFSGSLNCSATDSACLNALPLATILSAQQDFAASCAELDGAAAGPVPFRPVLDNSLITASLTTVFPSTLKPILVTNVKDEGGPSIYSALSQLPASLFPLVLPGIIPDERADAILASPYYVPDPDNADGLRIALKDVVTDLGFRCPDWTLARAWASRGGAAYTALFLLGATHPANDGIDFCTQPGSVCHQDEIPIVFGTARAPSAAQTQLIAEVQARIAAFIKTGNPNGAASLAGPALQNWVRTTATSEIPVLPLGGAGPVDMGACVTSFWGSPVAPYDYQLHGL